MTRVFWDVDTQHDFMDPDGALSVPNTQKIAQNLRALTEYAEKKGIVVIASQDKHKPEDPELQRNGGPWPDHCMIGTPGQRKIEATEMKSSVNILNKAYPADQLRRMIKSRREILIDKQAYSVFSNPNTEGIIKNLDIKKAVVYGVATDYCVLGTVKGLRERKIDVTLVSDAIAAVNVKPTDGEEALKEMRALGIKEARTQEVLQGMY